jgi:hypothetical protein
VGVDEAGRDDLALGAELLPALPLDLADGGDPAVDHGDVTSGRGATRSVDDGTAPDDEVEFSS